MNTFEEVTGIIGDVNLSFSQGTLTEFFEQFRLIRSQLGKQGYLLDKYLSYLFDTLTRLSPHDAATEGFDTAGELIGICADIIRNEPTRADHWFYETAKEYIRLYPLPYQEPHTLLCIYCVLLSEEFTKVASEHFLKNAIEQSAAVLDICDLNDLYEKMETLLGSSQSLEKLNLLFSQRFLTVNLMTAFQSGMTEQMLYSLAYRDRETSKQIFQLLSDIVSTD